MPLDPDSLINVSHEVKKLLPTLDPLDPQNRLAAIEAVRRIIKRYRYTPDVVQRLSVILSRFTEHQRSELLDYLPNPPPLSMSQEEIDQCFQERRLTLDDPAERAMIYRHLIYEVMMFGAGRLLLNWLRDHPQGTTPAEVDLLASLHDEFLYADVSNAWPPPSTPRIFPPWRPNVSYTWACLMRAIAPGRAFELAKTTPNSEVCEALVDKLPGGFALFKARFPNWSEDEKQREREYLETLHEDDFP